VLDPIINASTGVCFLPKKLINALKENLLPKTTLLTPNMAELFALTDEQDEQKAIKKLTCEWVLLTKTDVSDKNIEHRLYRHGVLIKSFNYQKLPHNYHGSGCTLASSIAALLAKKNRMEIACQIALDYTYQTLLNAKRVGKIQHHPNRHLSV
jgi:hydroxymethylpyrimidine/phosphomethylpyrimidine kinase